MDRAAIRGGFGLRGAQETGSVVSMSAAPIAPPARVKPKLRGVSHEVAFYVAIVATIGLAASAAPGLPRIAAVGYGASLVTLFGTSALYHRPMWSPRARARLRRADHAAIFVLIAGSYAPLGLLALPTDAGHRLLSIVWGGCFVGLSKALLWPHSPRWLTALTYLFVGWGAVLELGPLGHALGPTRSVLIALGGLCYTVGAIIYARKRPDPAPTIFGYHEIFHLLVIAAAALHFVAIGGVVGSASATETATLAP